MDKRYGISVFPSPMPKTPAGRFALVADLTSPTVVYDDDGNVVEVYEPILTPEEGLRLLETPMPDDHMPLGEKIERFCEAVENPPPPRVTKKVAWICYSGEDVEPDPMDNLDEEARSAMAVMKDVFCPEVCRRSLARYVERIQKLRSTPAKENE